ncbi:uncharacterized protein [Anabrus simplex]|uniref:uncharacterized protein isoform X2 n=1 Tax=Anabrus simplex TaxID=316456 RepID=UPI0035A3B036
MDTIHPDTLCSVALEPSDEVDSKQILPPESPKPQPMAFTIPFSENKEGVAPKNLRESLSRYAAKHMRNSSLPNVEDSKKTVKDDGGGTNVSPLPARKSLVTRRAGYHSEGYFSSDQEEDIRSRSDFFVRKLKSHKTTNLAQDKKNMAEQNSQRGREIYEASKHQFGDFADNEYNGRLGGLKLSGSPLMRNGRGNEECLSDEEVELPLDDGEEGLNDSSNETVSEAGTYTIERDAPCPEVIRARQDIENVILKVGRMKATSVEEAEESDFKMSLYRDGSNWINEWASQVAKHNYESGFEKPSIPGMPPLPIGKQQGPTPVSTSKIPSPVHQSYIPPSGRKHTPSPHCSGVRNLHSPVGNLTLHEPLVSGDNGSVERHSDSSLETESFLRTTESVVTAMQARMCLSMDSGGESDVDTSQSYQGPERGRVVTNSSSGDRYLLLRRMSNASDSSTRQESRATHSDSSSEAGETKGKRKELAGPTPPQMRYNRAFSLRRARLDCEPEPPGDKKKKPPTSSSDGIAMTTVTSKPKKSYEFAKPNPPRPTKIKSSKTEPIARTDCGRFSIRAPKPITQTPHLSKGGSAKKETKKKPGGRSNSTLSSREVEFQNWKRRKSYDPMKAAAEGKKKEAAKKATLSTSMTQSSIADPDTSPSHQNPVLRSASFHGTGGMTPNYVSSEEEVTLSADEDSPLSACPPMLSSASPPKFNDYELQVVLEGAFCSSRVSVQSTASNSSLRSRSKVENLDSLVMAAICGLSHKLRGTACKLLKKLRYLYDEDSERSDKLSDVIELLENTIPPGSPQTKSPSKELSGTLKNLKRIESVFRVLDDVLFDEEEFELEMESYQRD